MPKIDNMLAILCMLRSGEKITAKQISEKLEMNIRTVYRILIPFQQVAYLLFQNQDITEDTL